MQDQDNLSTKKKAEAMRLVRIFFTLGGREVLEFGGSERGKPDLQSAHPGDVRELQLPASGTDCTWRYTHTLIAPSARSAHHHLGFSVPPIRSSARPPNSSPKEGNRGGIGYPLCVDHE